MNNKNSIKAIIQITLLLGCFLIFVGEASAQKFKFSKVETAGSGCPIGSTDVVSSPDQKAVSILFNEMMVEVPQYDGDNENDEQDDDNRVPGSKHNKNLARKVCFIEIETEVAEGEMIDSVEVSVDFRGAAFIDQGAMALFHSQLVQWNGPQRISKRAKHAIARKVWRAGPVEEDYIITGKKNIDIKSNCGRGSDKKVKFFLKNIIKAGIRGRNSEDATALITLDSADMAGELKLKVNTKKCNARPDRPTRPTRPGTGGHTRPDRPTRPHFPPVYHRPQRCQRGYLFNQRRGKCEPHGRGRGRGVSPYKYKR